jgi:hypothetical protein
VANFSSTASSSFATFAAIRRAYSQINLEIDTAALFFAPKQHENCLNLAAHRHAILPRSSWSSALLRTRYERDVEASHFIAGFDTRTMPINGTYGGQGKAAAVTPGAALL